MDIAALAVSMKQEQLMQDVSLSITKQAMEFQQLSSEQMMEVVDAPHPTLGHSVDRSV